MSALRYYVLFMWRQIGTRHWSCLSEPTDYKNSPWSGSTIHTTVITTHSWQWRVNGPFWGHSDIGTCGCQRGIQSHCIMLSLSSMTLVIIWMASWELWQIRGLNEGKTCSWPWHWCDRGCPNCMLQWLLRWERLSLLITSSIISRSCGRVGIGTIDWILILRTRYLILHYPWRPFCTIWGMNTVKNIDLWRSIIQKAYRATISSPLQWLQDLVNHLWFWMICPVNMINPWHQTMRLKRYLDEAIKLHTYWLLLGSIWINSMNHPGTRGKFIQISMITIQTQWGLAVHVVYRTSPTGGSIRRKHSHSELSLQYGTRLLLYHTTWYLSGGRSFPCTRYHQLEAVKNHRRDSLGRSRCKEVCSRQ